MHKHVFCKFLFVIAIIVIGSFMTSHTNALTPFSWTSSALSLQKGADTTSVPTSLNGNIDCQNESATICSVPTTYGTATSNSTVRLNGTANYQPVISYIDNRQHFLPIPNSSTFISYTTEPPYGFYLYFNYNFTGSITKVAVFGDGTQYQVNRVQNGKLADKTNHRLAADYGSMSFSANGQWMVVSEPNVAMLRVNLQTFEVLPFAAGYNYTVGIDPSIKTAISNDGLYAAVSSGGFNTFKVYDLNSCAAMPDTITGPVVCQTRDLQNFISQQIPGYSFSNNVRFINNNALATYATYFVGPARKTAKTIIGSADSTMNQLDLLGIGESYISGEGAFNYQGGTDTSDNKCHLSLVSYPYLIGHDLNYNAYHSVACSGAITDDITNSTASYKGQAQNRKVERSARTQQEVDSIFASFKPGYINQLDFVSSYQPKATTISVGGNDMGFSSIITRCGVPWELSTCYSSYEDRLELVREINNQVFPKLVQTYQKLKNTSASDARIYAIGYPQIAKPDGDCALNVHLRNQEIIFSQQLVSYLDSVIKLAAAKAGVAYIDAQDALAGHRLCEAKLGSVAINGLTLGNDLPTQLGPIGNESYHPNDLGHQLLENKVLLATHNLTDPMPAANLNSALPPEKGLEILNAPRSGRPVSITQYDSSLTNSLLVPQTPSSLAVDGNQHSLKPLSSYRVELHSNPITLGNYITDANGNLNTQIQIPAGTVPGYHTLHIYGTNLAGDPIDVYNTVYIAASVNDYDGDRILNATDACVFVEPSGQDYDQDGADDACDGVITNPPIVAPPAPTDISTPPATIIQPGPTQGDQQLIQPVASAPSQNSGAISLPVDISTQAIIQLIPEVIAITTSPTAIQVSNSDSPAYQKPLGYALAYSSPDQTSPVPKLITKPAVLAEKTIEQSADFHSGSTKMIIIFVGVVLTAGLGTGIFIKIKSGKL